MKKWKGILAVILITGCLGGCSQFQAEHNAVKVKRDGSVQAAVIDTLDKSYYSEDELKQTIDDSVSAYNQSQEGDPIVVKKFNVTDGKAELYMNYAASRDYQDFNNVTFYTGDLQGAYDQKYEFPDEFQKVENGKVTGSRPPAAGASPACRCLRRRTGSGGPCRPSGSGSCIVPSSYAPCSVSLLCATISKKKGCVLLVFL